MKWACIRYVNEKTNLTVETSKILTRSREANKVVYNRIDPKNQYDFQKNKYYYVKDDCDDDDCDEGGPGHKHFFQIYLLGLSDIDRFHKRLVPPSFYTMETETSSHDDLSSNDGEGEIQQFEPNLQVAKSNMIKKIKLENLNKMEKKKNILNKTSLKNNFNPDFDQNISKKNYEVENNDKHTDQENLNNAIISSKTIAAKPVLNDNSNNEALMAQNILPGSSEITAFSDTQNHLNRQINPLETINHESESEESDPDQRQQNLDNRRPLGHERESEESDPDQRQQNVDNRRPLGQVRRLNSDNDFIERTALRRRSQFEDEPQYNIYPRGQRFHKGDNNKLYLGLEKYIQPKSKTTLFRKERKLKEAQILVRELILLLWDSQDLVNRYFSASRCKNLIFRNKPRVEVEREKIALIEDLLRYWLTEVKHVQDEDFIEKNVRKVRDTIKSKINDEYKFWKSKLGGLTPDGYLFD